MIGHDDMMEIVATEAAEAAAGSPPRNCSAVPDPTDRQIVMGFEAMRICLGRPTQYHEPQTVIDYMAGRQWSKELPKESGAWWWWNEDEDSAPIHIEIMFSGTDGSYFAPAGQYGWTRFQPVAEMRGWWMRLPEPNLPQNSDYATGVRIS